MGLLSLDPKIRSHAFAINYCETLQDQSNMVICLFISILRRSLVKLKNEEDKPFSFNKKCYDYNILGHHF